MKKLLQVMRRLRGKRGCPWDRKQTFKTLRRCLLEETHEVLEGIDEKNPRKIEEELGDLLAVISMLIALGEEKGAYSAQSVLKEIHQKLIRRHPHVFGKESARDAEHARTLWEREKAKEKGRNRPSLLDGIPKGYPALLEAYKIGKRVAKVGFDWPSPNEVIGKIEEELEELKQELKKGKVRKVREEIGDFLFSSAHLARLLGTDPEVTLLAANRKFQKRFRAMECLAEKRGKKLEELNTKALEKLWDEIKRKTQ